MIAYIFFLLIFSAIVLAISVSAFKEGWEEYRMSARVRIAQIRFRRAVRWISLFGEYVKGNCSDQPSLHTSKAS